MTNKDDTDKLASERLAEQDILYQDTQLPPPESEETATLERVSQQDAQPPLIGQERSSIVPQETPKSSMGVSKFSNTVKLNQQPIPQINTSLFTVSIPDDARPIIEEPATTSPTGNTGPTGAAGQRGPRGRQGERGPAGPEGPCCTGPTLTVDDTGLTLYGYTLGIDPDAIVAVAGISVGSITADMLHVADQIKFGNGMTAASIVTTVNGVSGDVTLVDLVGVATFNGATGGITSSTLHLHVAGLSCDGGMTFGGNLFGTAGSRVGLAGGPNFKFDSSGGKVELAGGEFLDINQYLRHIGDEDTWFRFGTNQINLRTGGSDGIRLTDDNLEILRGISAGSAGMTIGGNIEFNGNHSIRNSSGDAIFTAEGGRNVKIGDADGAGNSNSIQIRDSHEAIYVSTPQLRFTEGITINSAGGSSTTTNFQQGNGFIYLQGSTMGAYLPSGLSADGGVTFGSINTGGGLQVDGNIHTDGGISADGGISGGHIHCATLTSDGTSNVGGVLMSGGVMVGTATVALTASSATSATNATNVNIQAVSDDTDYRVIFAEHAGGGTSTLNAKVDTGSGADGMIYNPSTDLLSLGGISAGDGATFNAGINVTGGSTFGSPVSIGGTLDFQTLNASGTSGRWYLNQNGVNVGYLDQPNGLLRFSIYSMQTSRELAHLNDEDTFIRFPSNDTLQLSAGSNVFVEGTATNVTVEGSTLDAGVIHTQGISAEGGMTAERLAVGSRVLHDGDDDTEIGFSTDRITLKAGGTTYLNVGQNSCTDFNSTEVREPKLKDYSEHVNAIGTITGDTTVDFENGNVQTVTVNGGCTFSFSNPPSSGEAGTVTMIITNGGSQSISFHSAVKWPGDVAPTLTTSGVDILSFLTTDAGSNIYGFVGGINFS